MRVGRLLCLGVLGLAGLAWPPYALRGDTVQTVEGCLRGTVALRDGAVAVDGAVVPLEKVIRVLRDAGADTFSAPHTVRWKNGEVWRARILGVESNQVAVASDWFGQVSLGTEAIAALEFTPRVETAAAALRSGMLYREKGDPIPGTILWIREGTISLDCPLGVLAVPRAGVLRYLFKPGAGAAAERDVDEIGLTDGGILRGRLSLDGSRAQLAHAVGGTLEIPLSAIRYVNRAPTGVWFPGVPAAGDVVRRGLAPPPAPPQLVAGRWDDCADAADRSFVRAVRMRPATVARYRLPAGERRPGEFRAVAAPLPGSRGDVVIRVRTGEGAPAYERTLEATNAGVTVALAWPVGSDLTLEVDYGPRIAFPCGADWRDPHGVFRQATP